MDKISICTVCMNRTVHLRETLPLNIRQNIHYPQLEFVVLDYNSPDGLEAWVRECMQSYLRSGILKYYKTYEPRYFALSHSKNMLLKLAGGDILCLVDADNFAGPGYAHLINSVFDGNDEKFIVTTLRKEFIPFRDQGGKLSFRRDHFHAARGFDEALVGYGIEDVDLVNRLEKRGGKRFFLEDRKYLQFIGHSNEERVKNFQMFKTLSAIYLMKSGTTETYNRVLYLLTDNNFLEVHYRFNEHLQNNTVITYGGWVIKEDECRQGAFRRVGNELELIFLHDTAVVFSEDEQGLSGYEKGGYVTWKKISRHEEMYLTLVLGYSECYNRLKYQANDKDPGTVNPSGWGSGTVYLNFDNTRPISV